MSLVEESAESRIFAHELVLRGLHVIVQRGLGLVALGLGRAARQSEHEKSQCHPNKHVSHTMLLSITPRNVGLSTRANWHHSTAPPKAGTCILAKFAKLM